VEGNDPHGGHGLVREGDAGELPRRKYTIFRTRRRFELKKKDVHCCFVSEKYIYLNVMASSKVSSDYICMSLHWSQSRKYVQYTDGIPAIYIPHVWNLLLYTTEL